MSIAKKKNTHAFTVIELIIVVAILGVLMTIITSSFANFHRNSILNTEAINLVTLINKARVLSISAKNDTQYGVHLESGKAVLFEGGAYSPSSSTNETHIFETGLTLSNITVQGGGTEIVFNKITGSTSNSATTTLLITGTTASTTVVVMGTGVVSIR